MHSIRRSLVGFSLLGMILLAGASSPAQAASSNGPYYADPAWDQKLPAATRFIVLTDWNSEAVLDRETGLVWEQSPSPTIAPSWIVAITNCVGKSLGGRKGWRLPSMSELASLIDTSVLPPGALLPTGHPFLNVQAALYWSATTAAFDSTRAYQVDFSNGNVFSLFKTEPHYYWCVRSGGQLSEY